MASGAISREGIDHILIGAPDLKTGIEYIEEMTGCLAKYSGTHQNLGTHNALLAMGDNSYIEVIAPDPDAIQHSNLSRRLAEFRTPALFSWAWRCQNLSDLKEQLAKRNISTSPIIAGNRCTSSGQQLSWNMLFITDPKIDQVAPFLIDWGETAHPSTSAPPTKYRVSISLLHPHPQRLNGLMTILDKDAQVRVAPAKTPSLAADILSACETRRCRLLSAPTLTGPLI